MTAPFTQGGVRGFLHTPDTPNGDALALTHGAGGNCNSGLLQKVAAAFTTAGYLVLRFDLPFRQKRPSGPPGAGSQVADQANIGDAAAVLRTLTRGRVFVGGQSYGGRQASMLAAAEPTVADGLLLLSYPLHAPGKAQMRTQHFPALQRAALFVQGNRDPFATPDEIHAAVTLIAAPVFVSIVDGAGHDLKFGKFDLEARVLAPFRALLGGLR